VRKPERGSGEVRFRRVAAAHWHRGEIPLTTPISAVRHSCREGKLGFNQSRDGVRCTVGSALATDPEACRRSGLLGAHRDPPGAAIRLVLGRGGVLFASYTTASVIHCHVAVTSW
jgi:hypothetical protein